jgi:hypothetical protein
MSASKKRKVLIIIVILFIIIALPFIAAGISLIGRISPDSVIPDSFELYANVPNPVRFVKQVLDHEALPDIAALAELAPLMPALNQIKDSGFTENRLIRFAVRGRLDAAFLSGERILAAWDAGIASPLLRFLPLLAGRITVPGLYYVQAGKNSRFEYRTEDGTVFFIGPYKNLLVISNNSALYESVISGSSREGGNFGYAAKKFYSKDHDIAFLLSPAVLKNTLAGADPQILSAVNLLQFQGPIEASLSVFSSQLKLRLLSPIETNTLSLRKIIERNSPGAPLAALIPAETQYLTLLSAGGLKELLEAVSAIAAGTSNGGGAWETTLRRADNSARTALGMNLEELLFSWTGNEFAVYGLEGRASPVIAIEIRDEKKRREVFDKVFASIFVNENIQLNLDGNRIPRIQLPGFLNSLLSLMNLNFPSPYYTVQNNYLFISESAETLLTAVNTVKRNDVLPKKELWRKLSEGNSGPSSFSLFYSLDRSLPFFLKGGSAVNAVFRLYRQGLLRLSLENRLLNVSLSVIPGAGKGIVPIQGYPLDLAGSTQRQAQDSARGRAGNRLYRISSGKDTRLFLTWDNKVLAVNPFERSVKELNIPGAPGSSLYVVPQAEEAWVVNSQGYVSLVNKDLENLKGFPASAGIKLSAPPEAWGGKLFLCDENGSVHTVDNKAVISLWGRAFSSALRSPPFFHDFKNKSYAAVYPKSFLGEIFLLDAGGLPLEGWPVSVPGIAFGSPLLFNAKYPVTERLFAAFITQAGELAVYTENAETLPGFPLELEGVFYVQPVFDGENLWIIESEGVLYRIGLNGEVLSQKIPRLSVKEEGYITIANTGGNKPDPKAPGGDVFFSGEGNTLYGYSRHFNSLDGFPLPVWGRPLFADVNGDGKTEIAGVGMDNKLYMWQFR